MLSWFWIAVVELLILQFINSNVSLVNNLYVMNFYHQVEVVNGEVNLSINISKSSSKNSLARNWLIAITKMLLPALIF